MKNNIIITTTTIKVIIITICNVCIFSIISFSIIICIITHVITKDELGNKCNYKRYCCKNMYSSSIDK